MRALCGGKSTEHLRSKRLFSAKRDSSLHQAFGSRILQRLLFYPTLRNHAPPAWLRSFGRIRSAACKERTAELIKEFGKGEGDSGSAEVQVAILSERIRNLTEHLKVHKKDNHTRRGLMMLIGKRRGMLKYIKERDIEEYRALIKKLGIRDNI